MNDASLDRTPARLPDLAPVAYLDWAKQEIGRPGEWNLAASGVVPAPLTLEERAELTRELPLEGPNTYGLPALKEAIARRADRHPDEVLPAHGTSLANLLAMAMVLRPGDAVLLEEPGYEPLRRAAEFLGARVHAAPVDGDDGLGAFVREAVARLERDGVALVVITDLQNPTGAMWSETDLRTLHDAAERAGAWILVDEVYLEFARERELVARATARSLGDRFLVTSSLTKVYGFGSLRMGWVLAPPPLVRRGWDIQHRLGAVAPFATEELARRLLADPELWGRVRRRAIEQIETNRAAVAGFLESAPDVELRLPAAGSVALGRRRGATDVDWLERLRRRTGVLLTPGRFFQRPGWFRIGWGADPEEVAGGLHRLGDFLAADRTP